MFSKNLNILYCCIFILLLGCSDKSPDDNGNNDTVERPVNTSCLAGDRPSTTTSSVDLVRVFSSLSFSRPLAMVQPPNNNQYWFLIEQEGLVTRFENNDTTPNPQQVLDLRNSVDAGPNEAGLLGISFHPDFQANRLVYLSYNSSSDPVNESGNNLVSRVSEFKVNAAGDSIDPNSERIILSIDQPYGNHNGGNIAFGPDGYLYIGFGDGGSGGDPDNYAQNMDSLLGKFLRIDVNVSQADIDNNIHYYIPADNPFATSSGCDPESSNQCPEIFAWGVRNPWRWSFDRLTGNLWAGDVGQGAFEEVDLIEIGKNYGWRCYEADNDYNLNQCADRSNYTFPITAYGRTLGYSITGGYVYRGSEIPSLTGVYLYGDYGSRRIWQIVDPYSTASVEELFQAPVNILSFAQSNDAEIYMLGGDGGIYQFVTGSSVVTPAFPVLLTETGCADSADAKQATDGMISYDLNTPLWSDAATKRRWLALPDDSAISINSDHDWIFPVGSVLRKDFYLDNVIIETRLLARHNDGGWAGYSYEWNDTETDANLLSNGKDKQVGSQTWTYPSNSQCLDCHTTAAGRALGPETAQINKQVLLDGSTGLQEQMTVFDSLGLFDTGLSESTADLPKMVAINDQNASLLERVKSYLHVNCSHCHQPGGTGRGSLDLRYSTIFTNMNICNIPAETGDLGIPDSRLLVPNNPALSILLLRMQALDENRMPPSGTNLVDNEAVVVVSEWISSITSCP